MRLDPWLVAMVLLSAQLPAVAEDYGYRYFKEPRPLVLDETRIAVRGVADLSPYDLPRPEPWIIDGWSLVSLPGHLHAADTVVDLVERIAVSETVEFVTPVFFGNGGEIVFPSPAILMQWRDGVDPPALAEGLEVLETGWAGLPGGCRVFCEARNGLRVLELANALAERDDVVFAEPNMLFTGRSTAVFPGDPEFDLLWGIHNTGQSGGVSNVDVDAPIAWGTTLGDPDIVVVIIDLGIQLDHPDLNVIPGIDVTSQGPGDGSPVSECDWHGTSMAGTISAIYDNDLGIVGVAPGCPSASARTMIADLDCSGTWASAAAWTVDALDWAETVGARITNNSHDYGFTSAAIDVKYAQTRAAGMVHFAGTGNGAEDEIAYPASVLSVNAVGAIDDEGERWPFSNTGEGIAFAGPGVLVYTTDIMSDYLWGSGTSISAPYMAGVAALILSVDPSLSAFDVEDLMQASAVDLGPPGYDLEYGWGLVKASSAVASLVPIPPFRRGDANADGAFDISDPVNALGQLFSGAGVNCELALDANDDEQVNIADVVYMLDELFGSGAPVPPPTFPDCGDDPTPGPLGCECFPGCG